jgi:serine/threonine protein kinase
MSNSIEIPKADDLDSRFLLYHFSSDDRLTKNLKGQPQTDFLDVLAAASNLNIPFLPIIWQIARASVGIGGTSSIRQAPIDIQADLAFKLVKDDEKSLGSRSDILALIRNEIQILSHPRLRAHPNIVDLLGICWDIPDKDAVWPVLVFEKSYFGDLRRFVGLPIWKELCVKDRLKVCIDIGNALAEMHCCSE